MASEIKVDTIVNAGGDNDTGIDLATNDQILLKVANATKLTMNSTGQTTIVGEGGTTTTNVQQGLCKAWIRFNGESTIAINDSFNMASITDNDLGYYTTTYTNHFNTQYTSITISSDRDSNNHRLTQHFLGSFTTSNLVYLVNKDNSNTDSDKIAETIHGDLV